MSYGTAAALQIAVYQRLVGETALTDLVGTAIFDAPPSGPLPDLYVSLGPEVVRDQSDKTGAGSHHDFIVSVVSRAQGFLTAKTVAGIVTDALADADLSLARGALVFLRFDHAQAHRAAGGRARQIDLRFQARIDDSSS